MTKILTIVAELAAVGLVAAGVYLSFGTGPALIVAGSLVLAGIELYGIKGEPEEELDDPRRRFDDEPEEEDFVAEPISITVGGIPVPITTELDDGRSG